MIFLVAGLALVGLLAIVLGSTWAYRNFREDQRLRAHVGVEPVRALGEVQSGEVVHLLGVVESRDEIPSPSGAEPSAYLAVDLDCFAVGRPSYLRVRRGETLRMSDATGTATVQMELANVLDRRPYEPHWFTNEAPPSRIQPVIHQHGVRLPGTPANKGPLELRYCETALRHGDPLRVHGLVLDVQRDPAGRPHVTLGTDRRVWLYVSNTTDQDLVRMRAKARKWLHLGLGLIAAGLALAITGVSIGASMAR